MDYMDYEQKADEIRQKNDAYLELFKQDLSKDGLKETTIRNHIFNVDFYINEYLLREDLEEMPEGTDFSYLNDFFGYFFIRKCMWSSPKAIQSTAASLKKFYKSMQKRNLVTAMQLDELLVTIKAQMDEWKDECYRYDNDIDGDDFGFDLF